MASAIRDFSYLFIYSKKLEEYSTLARIVFTSTLVTASILAARNNSILSMLLGLVYVVSIALYVIASFRGWRVLLNAISLVGFFLMIGSSIYIISYFMGWSRPTPLEVVTGSLLTLALFLSFSCLFQLISLREWRRILDLLGLKSISLLLSLTVLLVPTVLVYTSEAFTAIKLKYGNRGLHRVIIPLVLYTFFVSRSLAESYTLFGVMSETKLTTWKSKDVYLYTASIIILLGVFTVGLIK